MGYKKTALWLMKKLKIVDAKEEEKEEEKPEEIKENSINDIKPLLSEEERKGK